MKLFNLAKALLKKSPLKAGVNGIPKATSPVTTALTKYKPPISFEPDTTTKGLFNLYRNPVENKAFSTPLPGDIQNLYKDLKRRGVDVVQTFTSHLTPDLDDSLSRIFAGMPTENGPSITFNTQDPLNLPKKLLNVDKGGSATMDLVERLTQQNRAKHMGYPYKPGTPNRFIDSEAVFDYKPWDIETYAPEHSITESIRDKSIFNKPLDKAEFMVETKEPNLLESTAYSPMYHIQYNKLKGVKSERDLRYAHPKDIPAALEPGLLRGTTHTPDTLLHEYNHFFTDFGNNAGTNSFGNNALMVPGFKSGRSGSLSKRFHNNYDNLYKPKAMDDVWTERYNKHNRDMGFNISPEYDENYLPNGYYNSPIEAATGIRSWKQILGSQKIPSVGLNDDLSEAVLENGTLPFNAAMVRAGYWKHNPMYNGRLGVLSRDNGDWIYAPKYIRADVDTPKANGYIDLDNNSNAGLKDASDDLMNQINYMQYMKDLAYDHPDYINYKKYRDRMKKAYEIFGYAAAPAVPTAYALYKANQDKQLNNNNNAI